MESAGLRATNRVVRTDRWVAGKRDVSGDITAEIQSKGMGLFLKAATGNSVITTPSGATLTRLHTYTLGDPFGVSYTIQVGRPDTSGTVDSFSYDGCKVSAWELSSTLDGFTMGKWSWIGQNESIGTPSLGTAAYPASSEVFSWVGGGLTIAGSAPTVVKDIKININNQLKADRYSIASSQDLREPILGAFTDITGSITLEFDSPTTYQRFVNGTVGQVVATWTGQTAIESTFFPSLTVTMPNVRFDGTSPNVTGPGIVDVTLPFKALYDGTNQPITIAWQTSDTTD